MKSAMFVVDDPKACLLYEMEDLQGFAACIEPLEDGVKAIYVTVTNCPFGHENLMSIARLRRCEYQILFQTLLNQFNETHCKGLEVAEEH